MEFRGCVVGVQEYECRVREACWFVWWLFEKPLEAGQSWLFSLLVDFLGVVTDLST